MKRGIYLVANLKSQFMCENLVYSIRQSGCQLPIRVIHFGGERINSLYIIDQAELIYFDDFPLEAKEFIKNIRSVLTECPLGFLYRFLAWYSDWDEFIYSDNDVVALCNWEKLFDIDGGYDLIHADEEYKTNGIYNYNLPDLIKVHFGRNSLESAITAGHIVVKRTPKMILDIDNAVEWFRENPDIPKKHDQALLHVAALIGGWKILNLCKPPHNWLSSWAGDYRNVLQVIQDIQLSGTKISHMHYSGGTPNGDLAIQDLLFSNYDDRKRLKRLATITFKSITGLHKFNIRYQRTLKLLSEFIYSRQL